MTTVLMPSSFADKEIWRATVKRFAVSLAHSLYLICCRLSVGHGFLSRLTLRVQLQGAHSQRRRCLGRRVVSEIRYELTTLMSRP